MEAVINYIRGKEVILARSAGRVLVVGFHANLRKPHCIGLESRDALIILIQDVLQKCSGHPYRRNKHLALVKPVLFASYFLWKSTALSGLPYNYWL